jgi:choline kinase
MKAIIMVAGVGSRLVKKVRHLPKCLLVFDNETILSRNIRLLKKYGINETIIVAGYHGNLVKEEVGSEARVIFNPFFRVTNSIASFWFVHKKVDLHDDLIVFNGDVIYQEEVLKTALETNQSPLMLIDTTRIEEADYRLKIQDGCVIDQGKELSNEETSGEYVGIVKMSKDFVPIYLSRVEALVESREKYNMWWEEALFEIRDEFKIKINTIDVKGFFWAEADYIEDINRIEKWFAEHISL